MLEQSTGQWNCCCPDCNMFYDTFDCCLTSGWFPFLFYTGELENNGNNEDVYPVPIPVAGCFDQNYWSDSLGRYVLNILPTRDLGPWWKWEEATGEWWWAISPDPLYTVYDSPCNDGVLVALTPGTLECRVGWPNIGYTFMVDIINESEGVDLTFEFFDPDGESDSFAVNYSVGAYDPAHGGNEVTLSIVGSEDPADTYTTYHSPLSPTNPSCRYSLTIATNGQQGVTCISLTRGPTNLPAILRCSSFQGYKFRMTSAGSPVALDNVKWDRQFVHDQTNLPCPTCGKCLCTSTNEDDEQFQRPFGPWKLTIECTCLNGIFDPTYYRLITGFHEDTTYCNMTGNRWYTDPIRVCGKDWYWELNCTTSSVITGNEYMSDDGGVTWHDSRNFSISVPSGFDCEEDLVRDVKEEITTSVFSGGEGCLCLSPLATYTFEEEEGADSIGPSWEEVFP